MTGQQATVMWLGLALIGANLVAGNGASSLGALFSGGPSTSGGTGFGQMTPKQQVKSEQNFAASVSPQYGSSFVVPGSWAAGALGGWKAALKSVLSQSGA